MKLESRQVAGYGWRPDLPDHRDFLLGVNQEVDSTALPPFRDLRDLDAQIPTYDQSRIGSCTGNATSSDLRYVLRRNGQADFDPSRLYIYYKARQIEGDPEVDAGAMLRDCMKVAAAGFILDKDWPYDITTFARPPRPIAELDDLARQRHALQYLRVQRDIGMRACLAAGFPFVFGIAVYESFEQATDGHISMPGRSERLLGGHALLCVGYDDRSRKYTFRNSWGANWGEKGYGYLPYDYLHRRSLSSDFWSIRSEAIAA
jgi:C1A family cysteine protease